MSTPPPSPPSDRLTVGLAQIVLSTREVRVEGGRRLRRVTPKAIGVLQALALRPGRAVTRAELLAEVWPDTLPTDDVLTQAIAQLRKAFSSGADPGAGKRYIETIAKAGYRLTEPVTWLADEAPPAPAVVEPPVAAEPAAERPEATVDAPGPGKPSAPSLPAVPSWRARVRRPSPAVRRAAWLGVLALGLGLGVALGLRWWGDGVAGPAHAALFAGLGTPLLDLPDFGADPALSPDGALLAYAAAARDPAGGVILHRLADGTQRRIAGSVQGTAQRPEWSPDGAAIAFALHDAGGGCRIMTADVASGALAEVADCAGSELPSYAWTPDGGGLIFGTMAGADGSPGLRVLSLDDGRWTPIEYPVAENGFDFAPRYSPDGRWIAFVRNPQLGDLWRIPAGGGDAEQITRVGAEIRGWAWSEEGAAIVFGRRVEHETRLFRVRLEDRRIEDLGLADAQFPTVSRSGLLAFVQRRARFGLMRVAAGGGDAVPLLPSGGRDLQPAVAPDGRRFAFGSDRSGEPGLWWGDLSAPAAAARIGDLRPDARHPAVWSPDSARLLVVGHRGDGEPALFEVEPATGAMSTLPVPGGRPLYGAYLPDPNHLLVGVEMPEGQAQLVLYDRSTRPWQVLRVVDGVSQARVDAARGRILMTRLSDRGLWTADLALSASSLRQVNTQWPSRWRYRSWALAADGGIDYLHATPACASTLVHLDGERFEPSGARCLDARRSAVNGMSRDPVSGALYFSVATQEASRVVAMADAPARAEPMTRVARRVARKLLKSMEISLS